MKKASEKFDRWLVASLVLHASAVLLVFVAPSLFQARTATWGSKAGGNGGVNIRIVSNMSGIALPSPVVTAEDAVVSDNKSLHKNEPEPKVKVPEKSDPDAIKLPSKTAPKKPAVAAPEPPVRTANATAPPPQNPSNAVAYGQGGGNPALRYGQSAPGTGPTGAEFGGDGTFGEKYGTYVDAMTRAITEAWHGINVTQQRAPRVYVTFTIDAKGQVSNVALQEQTSNTAMDRAAMQAVRSAKLPPLPADYHGPPVAVRFYFDYAK
jgi:periplasmic protein TonB